MELHHPNPKATDLQSVPLLSTEYFPLCDSRLDYLCRRAFTSITAGFQRALSFSVRIFATLTSSGRYPATSEHPGLNRSHLWIFLIRCVFRMHSLKTPRHALLRRIRYSEMLSAARHSRYSHAVSFYTFGQGTAADKFFPPPLR